MKRKIVFTKKERTCLIRIAKEQCEFWRTIEQVSGEKSQELPVFKSLVDKLVEIVKLGQKYGFVENF